MSPRPRPGLALLLAAVVTGGVLGGVVGGCSGPADPGATAEPLRAPFPDGLVAYVDQGRAQRQDDLMRVRLVDEVDGRRVRVTRAVVSSPRFDDVAWTGDKDFDHEADLELAVPTSRCGRGADADLTLTYRLDDGPELRSSTRATDRYGQVALLLDRACAASTLAEAADLDVGPPRVLGRGRDAVLELPVTLTPTGAREDVAFAGFEDTVLFSQTRGSDDETSAPVALGPGRRPVGLLLRLVPARCDAHALGEDKVGTLVGMRVLAPDVAEGATAYLPVGDAVRGRLRAFFARTCGF